MIDQEIIDLIATGLTLKNTPKQLSEEDGEQPSNEIVAEYGIEVPEEVL